MKPVYMPSKPTLSLLASRSCVSHTVRQDAVLERKIAATCGQIPYGSYGKWDQAMSCWRMSKGWLMGLTRTLRKSLGSFPRWGWMQSGVCIPLLKPEHHISEGAGGVWHIPTPTVSDVYTGKLVSAQQKEGVNHSVTLPQWVMWFPTPMTTDAPPGGGPPNKNANTKRWGGVNSLGQMAKNPDWAEWLMGVPIGWTGLKPLAMESYQQWLESFSND